jgi:ATP-dependent protease ClpP protease subunit
MVKDPKLKQNIDPKLLKALSSEQSYTSRPIAYFHEFYLSGPVLEPEEYVEWFDVIRNAGSQDTVKIHINSPGGHVDTALQFLRVLSETEAHTVASVEGSCMSAATMIFLGCEGFEVTPHSLFMFHNYSGGTFGKGGEMMDQLAFERKWSEQFLGEMYENFLTKNEIKQILDNKDIWLTSNDVVKRLDTLIKKREQALQDAIASATKE